MHEASRGDAFLMHLEANQVRFEPVDKRCGQADHRSDQRGRCREPDRLALETTLDTRSPIFGLVEDELG